MPALAAGNVLTCYVLKKRPSWGMGKDYTQQFTCYGGGASPCWLG
nr:MAG TPA: hypothetical protein [Caudoviricetes sp.]